MTPPVHVKQRLVVELDSIVHKHNRLGEPYTEVALALPPHTDLKALALAARYQKKGLADVRARLHLIDEDGEGRHHDLYFVKSTTKNFRFAVVMQLRHFSARHGLEEFLVGELMVLEGRDAPRVEFSFEIDQGADALLTPEEQAAQGLLSGMQDVVDSSSSISSVTISSGGQSVTLDASTRDRIAAGRRQLT